MLMNPGATSRPFASISTAARSRPRSPTRTMKPFAIATSAASRAAPVPSTTVPWRMMMSYGDWASSPTIASDETMAAAALARRVVVRRLCIGGGLCRCRLQVAQRQCRRRRAVDVSEVVVLRECRGNDDLAGPFRDIGIRGQRRDGTSDEFGRFGAREVENAGGDHRFGFDETGIERHDGHLMRAEFLRRIECQLVGGGLGDSIDHVAQILLCGPEGNVHDQAAPLGDHLSRRMLT